MSTQTEPSLAALVFTGEDALAFCQAQMASNLLDLNTGQWQWSALLSAQGRVQVLGVVALLTQQTVLLLLPAERVDALQTHLQRYVFRSRVQIGRSDVGFGFQLQARAASPASGQCLVESSLSSGCLYAVDGASLDICWPAQDHECIAEAEALHLLAHASIPWVDDSLSDRYTGHMLGLQKLGAISVKKGCYPGQEIVARTHYLGKSARQLRRAWSDEDLSAELFSKLISGPAAGGGEAETIGELVQWSPSHSSGSGLGLALVKQDTGALAWLQTSLTALRLDVDEAEALPALVTSDDRAKLNGT